MHEFLTVYRSELIDRCRRKVAERTAPTTTKQEQEREHGIPLFLDQLVKTLQIEQTTHPMRSRKVSGPSSGVIPYFSEMGESAARHGRELLLRGFTVDQVVHDYGDLCQAITDLAFEVKAPIQIDEFRTLNRSLDNAIAAAVTEFNYGHDSIVADQHTQDLNERLGSFAHELRNIVNTATLALSTITAGNVGLTGATGDVLRRSLVGLRTMVDRSLSEVRMTAGLPLQHRLFSLADFIAEMKLSASLEAQMKQCGLIISVVDPKLAVDADRELLFSALGNLLQNAFKFTHAKSEVTLNAYAAADRILIDVADKCGGLPPGKAEEMFLPFTQQGSDKTGVGLGLSISRRSVEANGGVLSVRDIPGEGCVFTIDLPRHAISEFR